MPRRKKDSDELVELVHHPHEAESAESLAKKLGVKLEGMSLALLWAPDGFAARIGIEEGNFDTDLSIGTYDLVLLFTASRVLLREFFPIAVQRLEPNGRIWIFCPRKMDGQRSDLGIDDVQSFAESLDLIESSRTRIEEVWSGIKFKKGIVAANKNAEVTSTIAPYSISVISSIPITHDPVGKKEVEI
jgi:hypothetical protein